MTKKAAGEIFSSSSALKILSFLAENSDGEFLGSEIQRATSLSRAGVYISLKGLINQGYVLRTQKGRFHLYRLDTTNPIGRQFKILRNILYLEPFLGKLQPISSMIILFGSAGRGEDVPTSDIDLFVMTMDPASVKEALAAQRSARRIQPVVLTPSEYSQFKETERTFYEEVNRGIMLWEKKE